MGQETDVLSVLPNGNNRKLATLGAFLADIDKEFAYLTQMRLIGLNLKHADQGWLATITAMGSKGKVVAFVGGHDPLEVYRNLWVLLHHKQLTWKASKW